jgi:hypothetical protein
MIDSCSIRAHERGAKGKKGLQRRRLPLGISLEAAAWGARAADWRALVNARGLPLDARGLPTLLKLTAGQADNGRGAADMLDALGPGQILLTDRGHDRDALRARLTWQGAWATPFRNLVERFFNGLKHYCSDPLRKARRQPPSGDLASGALQAIERRQSAHSRPGSVKLPPFL